MAGQLLGLGHLHASISSESELRGTVERAAVALYAALDTAEILDGPMRDLIISLLKEGATLWTGDGFAAPCQMAVDTPMDLRPYVCSIPEVMANHVSLFTAMGVPSTPSPLQYASGLQIMAQKLGTDQPLEPDDLAVALSLTECLGAALAEQGSGAKSSCASLSADAVLPDSSGMLAPASILYINDAPWLAHEDLRMTHPDVPIEAASALGAQSLRLHHQVETQTSERLPCPPAALLRQLLDSQSDSGKSRVADCPVCLNQRQVSTEL